MSRATKVKDFILRYYFKSPYKRHTLGPFVKGKFGVKEINDKLYAIVKTHKNDKGLWSQDPAVTEKEKGDIQSQYVMLVLNQSTSLLRIYPWISK